MHPPLFGQEKKMSIRRDWRWKEATNKRDGEKRTRGKKENKTRDAFSSNDPSAMQQQQHN
jgi:hypothetical protein